MKRIKPIPIVTRDSLRDMLCNPNPRYVEAVIGKALLALHQRQTGEERMRLRTLDHNEIGFGKPDASIGSRCAQHYKRHHRLAPWMIQNWLIKNAQGYPRLCKYCKQLDSIARYRQASISVIKVDKHE